ncbi:MAG: efflux RND transporter periplasmic adaptor subunit [Moraxellaceae bacterium]|nr:efflux RND transporter periplasmic adaptor subunit [Moraxellaceae bacterium]MBP9730952.1 efflux RND transporter periplasmic adaptor subunit [Moraxellaceae bacterium]MCC6199989.1 efflux RND transporter periplasmic adaptor subunit [Moraxellaceae bacterium]HQV41193.1 efflux RND transporter periplasmic adaptor subunit [Moraxellaceae bacterium]HQX89526.1 efflux RND transporter periplasmic adaptor subunit [Moraxellaceae bacterium]
MQYRVILQNVVRHPWMYSVGVLLTIVALVLVWPRPSVSSVSRQIRAIELLPSDSVVVKNERFDGEVSFTGTLMPVQQMLLNARIAGDVIDVPVREGQSVAAGAVLVRQNNLDAQSRLAQAEAAVQSSRAELETAREQMKKFRVLSQQNFFSRNDLEKAETQVAVYTAQVRANEAAVLMTKKALNDAVLRAPFSGVVAERLVEPGQLVMPNTPLLRLVDLSKLELAIQLPSSEIARVHEGQTLTFSVDAFGDEKFKARVIRLNPLAKASNRRITVYAAVSNADQRLRGGLFAKGSLVDENSPSGLVIPLAGVQEKNGQAGVMVIRQSRLVWQPVELGQQNARTNQVIVTKGLAEGESILSTRVSVKREGAPVRYVGLPAAAQEG